MSVYDTLPDPPPAPTPNLDAARHALLAAIEAKIQAEAAEQTSRAAYYAAPDHNDADEYLIWQADVQTSVAADGALTAASAAHKQAFLQAGCPPLGAQPRLLDGERGQYAPIDQRRPCATCPGWALPGSDFCADCSAEGGL